MSETNGNGPIPDPLKHLLPQHLEDLRRSGLSDGQIAACNFLSLDNPKKIDRLLGWKASAKGVTCGLVIPFAGTDGTLNGYGRMRPDKPRPSPKDGSPVRYESPKGKANRAYFPPGALAALADPSIPLVITEGEKKAAKGDQEGFPTIGLIGVWGWQKKRDGKDSPRDLIPDLEAVAWKGRVVYLCYDSDLADKPDVARAEWHLAEVLTAKGATVKVTRLPAGPEGAKVGLDDYLVANSPDDFRKALEAAQPPAKPKDDRPEVILGPLEFLCIDEGIKALAKGDKTLYQRGGQLVRVVRPCLPVESQRLRGSGGPKIETVPTADLRTRLTQTARIIKIVPGKKDAPPEKKLSHPPPWLVQGVEAVGRWPGIRPLEAVVTSPMLLPDGTVLQRPGYDAKTGLFYEMNDDFPPIPDRPTRADVERARDALLEIVADFPFAKPEHRAAYVASVLTPLARFAFEGPAPLFLIDGNVRGTGKGLLADTAARVTTGRNFARAAYAPDPVEMKKVITAIALSGEQLVLLDNIGAVLGDSSLDAALTATDWQERVLCTAQRPRLPLIVTWYATGNNIVLMADTARRVCHIRLNSPDEKPEERSGFQHADLLAWVAQERGRLLTAALTILSGYCRAGRPDQKLKPWGSFEGWTALVRQSVVWAGLPDPGLTREMLAESSDRDAGALRGMIAGWLEIDPDREGKTVAEVLTLLEDTANASCYPVLRGVLAEVFDLATGKLPTSRKLGYLLRKFVGRNAGGQCFDHRDGHGGVKLWYVRDMGGRGNDPETGDCGGDGGDGGHVSSLLRGREDSDSHTHVCMGEKIASIPTITTNSATAGVTADGTPFVLVTDPAGLEIVRAALEETGVVGLDCETTSLSPRAGRCRLLSLTTDTVEGGMIVYVVDCFAVDPSPLWEALAERPIVGHNLTFDLGFLAALGFEPAGPVHDTMILSQLLHGTRRPKGFHGLQQTAERELGRLLDKTEQKGNWSGDLTPEQLQYAAADAAILPPLFADLSAKLRTAGLMRVAEIERRALPAVAWLYQSGASVDRDAWAALAAEAKQQAEALAAKLGAAAPPQAGSLLLGDGWNWDSPQQVKEVFAALGVTLESTDDDALAAVSHPLAALVREYRSAGKLASTYGDGWYGDALHGERVYAAWKQLGCDSGRMACREPNMQNLPRDPRYRRCFIAPANRVLVKADYSQIELRIAAKLTGDRAMLDAYARNEDLHAQTARLVLGVKDLTKGHRQLAKAINFGLLYGMGAKGFRVYAHTNYGVLLTEEEAGRYRDAFFTAYPGLRRWHRSISDGPIDTRTLANRRRAGVTRFTEKLNTPVQGTGADGLKQALALLWERRDQCPGAFPVLVVHDEIVVEADADRADAAADWLKRAMLDGMAPLIDPVPCEVEIKIAQTWEVQ